MFVCPLRPPLLTRDWLGCCGIELDWVPDPRSLPAVMVVLVPDDKLDMGCWEDGGGLLMCAVGGGGAGPWPPWWGRPVTISAVLIIRLLMISYSPLQNKPTFWSFPYQIG